VPFLFSHRVPRPGRGRCRSPSDGRHQGQTGSQKPALCGQMPLLGTAGLRGRRRGRHPLKATAAAAAAALLFTVIIQPSSPRTLARPQGTAGR
jgi:hypothetical protein